MQRALAELDRLGQDDLAQNLGGVLADYSGDVRVAGHRSGPESKAAASFLPDTIRVRNAVELYRDFFADSDVDKANELIGYFGLDRSQMLISTHLMQDIENVVDHVVFLRGGRLELQGSADDLREYYLLSGERQGQFVRGACCRVFAPQCVARRMLSVWSRCLCRGSLHRVSHVSALVFEAVNRYSDDVLRPGWQQAGRKQTKDVPLELDLVVEDPMSGFCGAVVGWENGVVILEDRRGKRRSFPVGPGFLLDGEPVALRVPPRRGATKPTYTASGSRIGAPEEAKVALPSRLYVEGRHDAELIEKVWGDDLRHVGVVVEYLGGIDDLPGIVTEFRPGPGRRLGVLVDHLVPGSKESRIAAEVRRGGFGDYVLIAGHEFIDIWQAVRPERIGRKVWPNVPRDVDFKKGTLAALGLPYADQRDIARGWQAILDRVRTWKDLDPALNTTVETLIDFVTQDHS